MQPYFLPYIGYFQLINAVDQFVVYDEVQYTKKGWINRNRILVNNKDSFVTLPLKKDSDYLNVRDRSLSDTWNKERVRLLDRIRGAYGQAPCFKSVYPLVELIVLYEEANLFEFIHHSIKEVAGFLGIDTPIVVSSSLKFDNSLKAGEKVLDICKAMGTSEYINLVGGLDLYDRNVFADNGIKLDFLEIDDFTYCQFGGDFVSFLSILDVLMFNDLDVVRKRLLNSYSLRGDSTPFEGSP